MNLIGDHTDYQDGFCLPMAIDRAVHVEFRPRDDEVVHVESADFDGIFEASLDGREHRARTVVPAWSVTVWAVLAVLQQRGSPPVGFDAAITSEIPVGSGLSSSAAFEVAVLLAAADAAGVTLEDQELALAAVEAEHLGSGVPCGVMDQMASVFGRAGHALLLDCRTLAITPVALPSDVAVVVAHSGVPRRLEESAYADRRSACERAATRLDLSTLRDATPPQVASDPYARHVVSENARVLAFVDALRAHDLELCGRLMLESHASLRDDFAVSTSELDTLVDRLVAAGAYGARLTGAGFGGCAVGLCPAKKAARIAEWTAGWVVHAADGARIDDRTD